MKKVLVASDSPREIMDNTGCSRTTAWRARKRGYLCQDYHKKAAGIGIAVPEEMRPRLYAYFFKVLPGISQFDADDLVANTIFVALYSPRTNKGDEEQFIFGIARTQARNYRAQGLKSIINAVENWTTA